MMDPMEVEDARAWALGFLQEQGVDVAAASKRPQAYKQLGQGTVYEGQGRNNALASLAGLVRSLGGFPTEIIHDVLATVNVKRCQPPLSDKEVATIASSIGKYTTSTTTPHTPYVGGVVVLQPVSLGTLEEPPPRKYMVDTLIPEGHPTVLYGHGGQGKSLLALTVGMCIAKGLPFIGLEVIPGNVLYLDWELDEEEHTRRAYQIARGLGMKRPPKNLWYQRMDHPLRASIEAIQQSITALKIEFLIIDSLGAACGDDPESAKIIIPLFVELRKLRTTILVIDHQAKLHPGQKHAPETPFGSVYKYNMARSVIHVQSVGHPNSGLVKLTHLKSNFGQRSDLLGVRLCGFKSNVVQVIPVDPSTDPAFIESKVVRTSVKILEFLQLHGALTAKEVAEKLGAPPDTVGNELSRMRAQGLVRKIKAKTGRQALYEAIEQNVSSSKG